MSKPMTKERIAEILKQKRDWRWTGRKEVGECLDEIESLQAEIEQLNRTILASSEREMRYVRNVGDEIDGYKAKIESLRKKLAITKDGYAVGLVDNVFHLEPDGTVSSRTVWARKWEFKACWGDHGPPVDVSDCYASLTTAMEVAEEMKESEACDGK